MSLKTSYNLYKPFKENAIIDSIESAMFATIVTILIEVYRNIINRTRGQANIEQISKEIQEIRQIVESRSQIIKSRIRGVANL
jgi:peptidoglycan hydrolase CwlO-like protein